MNRPLDQLKIYMLAAVILTGMLLTVLTDGHSGTNGRPEASGPEPSVIEKVGDWTVTTIETITDDTVTLKGNLTIKGTLVLDNTTLALNTTVQDTKWVRVEGGGKLRLRNGSILRGLLHSRYHFQALASSSVHINGSQVMDCGTDSVSDPQRGIYSLSNDLIIYNSMLTRGQNGILVDGGSAKVIGSSIIGMDGNGIEVVNGGDLLIRGSNITFCGGSGLELASSSANITSSTLKDSQKAVSAMSSTLLMEGSRFSSRGIQALVSSSSWLFLRDCSRSSGSDQLVLDLPVSGPSKAELVNTTLNQFSVLDPNGRITEAYRKDVQITTNGGKRADQAEVEIRDRYMRLEFHGITPPSGELLDINVVSHITNISGRYPMDLHQLWVRLEGARRTMDFDSMSGHVFNMTVLLSDPEVLIDRPLNGTHIPSNDITVSGRVIDVRPVSALSYILDDGDEVTIAPQSTFSIPLNFQEGPHDILMICMNDDGRFGTARASFFTDTIAPVIELLNPLNNSVVNTTTVLFAGSCEPEVRFLIDDELVPHSHRTFRHYVRLGEGFNSITLEAWDLAGNGLSKVVHVTSDTTAPFIAVMTPLDGYRTKETSITIKGTTSLDTVGLTVNGFQAQLSEGTFQVVISGLIEGENPILLTAIDRVGWRTTKELKVVVDSTPPMLVLRSFPAVTNKRDIELSGIVDEEASVTVNGMAVVLEDGGFSILVELYQGQNRVLVRATDAVGNTVERTAQIVLDLEAPVIERVQPPSGSSLRGNVLQITGQAFDENGISSMSGRRTGGAFQTLDGIESWSWVIELTSGLNQLEVRAEDRAGNVRTLALQYTLEVSGVTDRTPPIVTIVDPRMNASLRSGVVWVKGTATDNVGIGSVQLRVGDGEWTTVEGMFRWSLNVTLAPGYRIIEVRALDTSGNQGTDTVKVLVTAPNEEDVKDEENGPKAWMYAVLVFLLIMFMVMAVYLVLRRKALKQEIDQEKVVSGSDRHGRTRHPPVVGATERRPGPRGDPNPRRPHPPGRTHQGSSRRSKVRGPPFDRA
ncbi:MAG: Ig-like domain-containing protein [Candidatus Thermoplasmatota archaeon]|jgi:hypothetical protein|nr:Ig-like domain-containing protein [Candidatus Thermoplasmatota archaeon]